MFRKSLIVFVISIFLFSAFALTEAYAFRGHEPSAAGIEVYDADGQYLGVLAGVPTDSAGNIRVYAPSLSSFLGVNSITGKSTVRIREIWFQSDDCTGIPYINADYTYDIAKFGAVGGKQFYTGARIAPVQVEIRSHWNDYNLQFTCIKFITGIKMVVPAEEVPADSLPFTFPVALPLEFK